VNIVTGRRFNYTVLEEECSKNGKLSKGMTVYEEIVILLWKHKLRFSELVGSQVPNKVIVYQSFFIFEL
jgi:hypothetical protein